MAHLKKTSATTKMCISSFYSSFAFACCCRFYAANEVWKSFQLVGFNVSSKKTTTFCSSDQHQICGQSNLAVNLFSVSFLFFSQTPCTRIANNIDPFEGFDYFFAAIKFWQSSNQCDQMAILLFNIGPFTTTIIFPVA